MSHFRNFIYLFLVVCGAHRCMAKSGIIEDVYKSIAEIDKIIEKTNSGAEKYKTELQNLNEQLTTNVTGNTAQLSGVESQVTGIVRRHISLLITAAGDVDVSECTDLSFPVLSIMKAIMDNGRRCIREEVEDSNEDINSLQLQIEFQINTLARFQNSAKVCVALFDESSQSVSEAADASACVKPLLKAAKLLASKFDSAANIKLVKSLLDVYETRVTKCASTSLKNFLAYAQSGDRIGDDIVACVRAKVPGLEL